MKHRIVLELCVTTVAPQIETPIADETTEEQRGKAPVQQCNNPKQAQRYNPNTATGDEDGFAFLSKRVFLYFGQISNAGLILGSAVVCIFTARKV